MSVEQSEVLKEVEKIGTDLKGLYEKLEGKVKEKASSEDIEEISGKIEKAEQKYDDFEKKYSSLKEDIDKLSAKLNRDAGLFTSNEQARKSLEKGIFEALEKGVKDGKVGESATGNQRFDVKDGHIALHRKAVGTITTGNLTDGSGGQAFSAREISQRVITSPSPKIRIRQLLNSATMTEALREYPKYTGGEGAPDYQTAEGNKKAVVDYDFQMIPIVPKTIAATADVSKQSLADIGWLSNFMSTQMLLDLLKKEDTELLNGAGGANAIHGLIPQSTAFVASGSDVESIYDVLIDAAAQVEELDYDPNGFLLHPRDFSRLLRYKSTTKEYNHPGLVYEGGLLLNGIPIYKASQVAKGTGLVADWSNADLLVREGISFNISYENKDNFEKNLVTLRIEERIALAVYRPQAFVSFEYASFPYAS